MNYSFTYWFKRIGASSLFYIYATNDLTNPIGEYHSDSVEVSNYEPDLDRQAIISDFAKYELLPEYRIGLHIERDKIIGKSQESFQYMHDSICDLIRGCCSMMYSDREVATKYADRAINWLEGTDFYVAPASTKYHDCEVHGLMRHTLKVVNAIIDLSSLPQFVGVDLAEATLAAIVHDWCKIDFYESYMKNVKNETTGVWEKELAYRYKGIRYPFGHGVTSMFIASRMFKLSIDQALAVRWHMGEYNVCDNERHDLMEANERYPMVQMLQIADRMAIL